MKKDSNISKASINYINVKGAREHNLKNIDVSIPRNKFIVITGLSGSGKSSLAFDTIYAEGQRRYVESLSAYARQFLGVMEKPDVDNIDGLSPAISIEQKVTSKNPRSTVGTITEIYDYLRLLFARAGTQYCHKCNGPVKRQTPQQIVDNILQLPNKTKFKILGPVARGKKGEFKDVIKSIASQGFVRIKIDGKEYNLPAQPKLEKNKKHDIDVVIDRLIMDKKITERLNSSVELALKIGNGIIIVEEKNSKHIYSEHHSCPRCNLSFEDLQPRLFSFNSPFGACSLCSGLGTEMSIDPDLVVPDKTKSILQGCIVPIGEQPRGNWYSAIIKSLSQQYDFSYNTPWYNIEKNIKNIILYGTKSGKKITLKYSSSRFKGEYTSKFEGVIPNLKRRHTQTSSSRMREWIEKFMSIQPCRKCRGARLSKSSLAVKINGKNIHDLSIDTIGNLKTSFENLKMSKKNKTISKQIVKEIYTRLEFLVNVGVEYLTLNRSAGTLSGGEAQRIRLATQIGSQLVGVLYILDEPTIGLHQRDNKRLIKTLTHLRDIRNTVIVVEHDKETIQSADWIIDMGPGAGKKGGSIVSSGDLKEIIHCKESLTGQYLSGVKKITFNKKPRKTTERFLIINGASGNNLKNIRLQIPLGRFICITGVSGSGKSTIINQTLYPALLREFHNTNKKPLSYKSIEGLLYLDKVINIDQSPIGKTPRSNPATYTGLFTHIRDLFSQLPESKIRGYKPGRFSFNVKGGRCESCEGVGLIRIEMHFLPDMYIQCEECKGMRYNRETLEIMYRGKTIADILSMPATEARDFFKSHISINRKLETLYNVGLGYIQLGQQATTLSGGESQRVKLSAELSKIGTGRTLYILDEPTTGLHFEDVKMLLTVLHHLVEKGNTVLVIEHNLDVIKTADWIVDLGPEGGNAGGEIIAEGTPKNICKIKRSYTGKFLKTALQEC